MPPAGMPGQGGRGPIRVAASTASGMGPLVVSSANTRYLAKPDGSIVYLTGVHTWSNFQDWGTTTTPPVFDFTGYLSYLVSQGMNYCRLWAAWEYDNWVSSSNPTWYASGTGRAYFGVGCPYARTGPSNANDGKLKYDLSQWNQAWFDRLRARVIACRDAGIYCQILLFNPFPVANDANTTNGGFPMQSGNNINSLALTFSDYWTLNNSTCTAYQDAYVQKVIDTVNDLPNVFYEIANEPGSGSIGWQNHVVSTIKTYQAGKPYQHPVVMTGYSVTDADLLASNADMISPQDPYFENDGTKVVDLDSDHSDYYPSLAPPAEQRAFAWRSLCRGGQPAFMDPWFVSWSGRNSPGGTITGGQGTSLDTTWSPIRNAIADVAAYAARINLKLCTPQTSLSTTNFCIANAGHQYLAFQPGTTAFDVTLVAASYTYEWFDAVARTITGSGSFSASSGARTFTPPNSNAHVLLLQGP
jgi:hypothetical protein